MALPPSTAASAEPRRLEPLWVGNGDVPATDDLKAVSSVQLYCIKPHEPARDGGYGFLHGVALAWHRGRLIATWGHNRGKENSVGEQARGRISDDGGRTWSQTFDLDTGTPTLAVSHGVLLSHQGRLWAWQGAFTGRRQDVHTRLYLRDDKTGGWDFHRVVVRDGFWPMEPPRRMDNGNWLMSGLVCGPSSQKAHAAAVAISRGDDLRYWQLVTIPPGVDDKMWGESSSIIQGATVLNIARYGAEAWALTAVSHDYGQTWTTSSRSNLPMATSKPFAGQLSTGEYYLICTTVTDGGKRRSPLTIALSRPGEIQFSRILKIRDAVTTVEGVESHPAARLGYPYAIEHQGNLYVGYSNSGGRPGLNINSAELAVVPVSALK